MKIARVVPFFAIVLAANGCSGGGADMAVESSRTDESSGKKGAMESTEGLDTPSPINHSAKNFAAKPSSRAVIRNGSLSVRVGDVETAEQKITNWVTQQGGYVATSDSSNLSEASPTLTMSLRVPVGRFDSAFRTIEAMGTRLAKKISARDVTAEAVDLDARLSIMRAQEQSFRNALARMSDQSAAYDMQTRLMELRGQIESLTAQRKSLGDLAALSTIDVTLQGSAKGMALTEDKNWAAEVWNSATSALGVVLRVLGSGLILLVVFSPVWLPILIFGFRLRRKTVMRDA